MDEHCARHWIPARHAEAIKAMVNRHQLNGVVAMRGKPRLSLRSDFEIQPRPLQLENLQRFVAGSDMFSSRHDGLTISQHYANLGLDLRPQERQRVIPNHTGKPSEFIVKHIATRATPRGITCSADGKTAYVAGMLDDAVTVIDLRTMAVAGHIDLGGARELTRRRRGEKLFHSANISFRRQFSCSSCHPDGHIDNIVYDIEDDGIGMGPIDNRTLRGINDMAPYKWIGINPSLRRRCGPRLAVFITRIQPFTPAQLDDLHYYLCSYLGGQPGSELGSTLDSC